jgi:hypothetical protein
MEDLQHEGKEQGICVRTGNKKLFPNNHCALFQVRAKNLITYYKEHGNYGQVW